MKLNVYFTPLTYINLKQIKDLNISPYTIELLEDNQRRQYLTLVLIIFFSKILKAYAIKAKINKQDYIELKKKTKKQTTTTTKNPSVQRKKPSAKQKSKLKNGKYIYKSVDHILIYKLYIE